MNPLRVESPWLSPSFSPFQAPGLAIDLQGNIIPIDNSVTNCRMTSHQVVTIVIHQDIKYLSHATLHSISFLPFQIQTIRKLDQTSNFHILSSNHSPSS